MNTDVYKALSDENRLRIINILMKKELCVCEIEAILNMSQSNVSRHLNKLKAADIVTSRKESQWAFYTLSDKFIRDNVYLYEHLQKSLIKDEQLNEDVAKLSALEILPKCGGQK